VGAVSLGYAPNGKRRRPKVYGKTKTEVRQKIRYLKKEVHRRQSAATSQYFRFVTKRYTLGVAIHRPLSSQQTLSAATDNEGKPPPWCGADCIGVWWSGLRGCTDPWPTARQRPDRADAPPWGRRRGPNGGPNEAAATRRFWTLMDGSGG